MRVACLVAMLPLLLVACSPVRLSDTTDLPVDPAAVSLGTPYVVGASFGLTLEVPRHGAGWTVESGDASVLAVSAGVVERDEDGDEQLKFDATALAAGKTTLSVRDPDGTVRFAPAVEVAAPTRVELRAATQLAEAANAEALDSPRVCVGGSAAFRVDFFDGDRALSGSGGLTVEASGVTVDQSGFVEDHDWIVVAPTEAGPITVALTTGGVAAGSVGILAVGPEEVAGIALDRDPEAGAHPGDSLAVRAQARAEDGASIFGAPFSWSREGMPAFEEGDEFVYEFDPDTTTRVTVSLGSESETFTAHGEGSVYETDSVVCAVANVGPVGLAIVLAAAGVVRRRRGLSPSSLMRALDDSVVTQRHQVRHTPPPGVGGILRYTRV